MQGEDRRLSNSLAKTRQPEAGPELQSYDILLCNISGGKDSQAMLDVVVQAAEARGIRHRIVTVFCDLGDEDEWPGTRELAAEHAAHYRLRHEVVFRTAVDRQGIERRQGLTEHIETRRQQKWPDQARRYCTSDMKRGPVLKLMTRLTSEMRAGITDRRVRILNIMGMRREESPNRALLEPYRYDARASNRTRRSVEEWLPVLDWTVDQIWDRLALAGTRVHPIYAVLPRLACRFCVLAGRQSLVTAARLDPRGARRRAALERTMGHQFRADVSMKEIIDAAHAANLTEGPLIVDGVSDLLNDPV